VHDDVPKATGRILVIAKWVERPGWTGLEEMVPKGGLLQVSQSKRLQ